MTLIQVHARLLDAYGPQGWWPLLTHEGTNPTKTGSLCGYHVGDYSFPRNDRERFEICLGAILTQNTAWPNVEKALRRLADRDAMSPRAILDMTPAELIDAIRPSGYYNVKARKLRRFAEFLLDLGARSPTREQLLGVWGVGPETADSMLLYAYGQPHMVVDAYTRRVLGHLSFVDPKAPYAAVKECCENALPEDVRVYQEFHALIVEHAKRHYSRQPWRDPLLTEG